MLTYFHDFLLCKLSIVRLFGEFLTVNDGWQSNRKSYDASTNETIFRSTWKFARHFAKFFAWILSVEKYFKMKSIKPDRISASDRNCDKLLLNWLTEKIQNICENMLQNIHSILFIWHQKATNKQTYNFRFAHVAIMI